MTDTIELLRRLGSASTKELAVEGVSPLKLQRLVKAGQIERIGRGMYALPGFEKDQDSRMASIAQSVTEAVVVLETAASLHGLTNRDVRTLWLAIPGRRGPLKVGQSDLAVRIVRWQPELIWGDPADPSKDVGIRTLRVAGRDIQITSPERTVADVWRYRNKLGMDFATEVVRLALASSRIDKDEIVRMAELVGVARQIDPILTAFNAPLVR